MNTNQYIKFKLITLAGLAYDASVHIQNHNNVEILPIVSKDDIQSTLQNIPTEPTVALVLIDHISDDNNSLLAEISSQLRQQKIHTIWIISKQDKLTEEQKSHIGTYGHILFVENQPFYSCTESKISYLQHIVTTLLDGWDIPLEHGLVHQYTEELEIFFKSNSKLYLYDAMNPERLKSSLTKNSNMQQRLAISPVVWAISKEGSESDCFHDTLEFIEDHLHVDAYFWVSLAKDFILHDPKEKIYICDIIIVQD